MTVTFKRFDAADYLRGAEDIAAYLDVVSEEGDPAQMIAALSTVARAGNVSQLAGDAELTRDPSFTTVSKIARALGLRLELHLQPAEAGQ